MAYKQFVIFYLLFAFIGYSHTTQLASLEQQFYEIIQQLDNVEQQLHNVKQQLSQVAKQLVYLEQKLSKQDQQFSVKDQLAQIGQVCPESAITYILRKNSRFGDYIILYSAAKFISEKYGIQLFYKRFPFSHLLAMDHVEKKYDTSVLNKFKKIVPIRSEQEFIKQLNSKKPLLFNVSRVGFDFEKIYSYIQSNTVFRNTLRKMISPIKSLDEFCLPQDRITVAVHVRKGGGYDPPLLSFQQFDGHLDLIGYMQTTSCKPYYAFIDQKFPLKFPPDQYYIDQIKKLSEMLNDVPLYVYLFTDDPNPVAILEEYEWAVGKSNILFDCRKEENNYDLNVIEDFFAMTKFDCLIRPQSNFSRGAQLMGKYKVIIHPQKAEWFNGKLIITMINIITDEDGVIFKTNLD